MTKKEFIKRVAKEKKDLLNEFVSILKKKKIPFCVIGGLAVNAYAEPVVSLDLDVVIAVERLDDLVSFLPSEYRIKEFSNSINISAPFSDLRIQIQLDKRYQDFINRAIQKEVLGYKLPVASIKDVLKGKIWAFQDKERRPSKRQKDLADIIRLIEVDKGLIELIPEDIKKKLEF
uniref:Nucleotidyltransferase family protein n=1 Tax=candidate division WOR-3 bacterium TaxID=2052148 RepID=A0A7V0Z6C5_UNCW3